LIRSANKWGRSKGEEVREKHERERNNQHKNALAGRDNVGPCTCKWNCEMYSNYAGGLKFLTTHGLFSHIFRSGCNAAAFQNHILKAVVLMQPFLKIDVFSETVFF
jgi:hypothetical protein